MDYFTPRVDAPVRRNVYRYPNKVASIFGEERLTYRQLNEPMASLTVSAVWESRKATGWPFLPIITGDMATMDEENYIYLVDRKNDMIISGSENIYPKEVKNVLFSYPAILEGRGGGCSLIMIGAKCPRPLWSSVRDSRRQNSLPNR